MFYEDSSFQEIAVLTQNESMLLPIRNRRLMPQNVDVAIIRPNLKEEVVGTVPLIEYRHDKAGITINVKPHRSLISRSARVNTPPTTAPSYRITLAEVVSSAFSRVPYRLRENPTTVISFAAVPSRLRNVRQAKRKLLGVRKDYVVNLQAGQVLVHNSHLSVTGVTQELSSAV